jgi:N utilization substance protein B
MKHQKTKPSDKKNQHQLRQRARRRAIQALYQWEIRKQSATEISDQFRQIQDFSQIDEAFFEQALRGVIDEHKEIDEKLQVFLDRPINQVDIMERAVLRLGSWELLHCPEVPYRVVLNECVDLARRFGAEQGHAFINGVLDKAAKKWRPDELALGDSNKPSE